MANYYYHMGWDRATGKPLPLTLKRLGLEPVIADLWGSK
ncbi:MAG: aldehyde ferredoxin oxidoreductase C-terminal domain-containing protein [Chloroflexota bacterium]|nr:aldehyde ferredoxin oxidoreductase C-terminal domain-containing protein [Chloroflexota bacterium]